MKSPQELYSEGFAAFNQDEPLERVYYDYPGSATQRVTSRLFWIQGWREAQWLEDLTNDEVS